MDIKREDLVCKDCMSPSRHGFKKVIGLKNSGLVIYLHKGEESKKHDTLKGTEKKAVYKPKSLEIFILHNDSEYDLRRLDYATEMCQLRTRCFRCINLVKRVQSLLDEFNFIRKNEVIGLCEHCKRNPGACKRCQYIVSKFLENKVELHKEKQTQFKSWLNKLNQFLHFMLNDANLERGQISSDTSALELERLLQELKSPLQLKKLQTTFFPTDLAQLSSITEGHEMIDELLTKIKPKDQRKFELNEELPPLSEGMLRKEPQKGRPRRLPPLRGEMQNKRFHEWIEKDDGLENQSKNKPTNITKSYRNKDSKKENDTKKEKDTIKEKDTKKEKETTNEKYTKREKNKARSATTTNFSTAKPLIRKLNVDDGKEPEKIDFEGKENQKSKEIKTKETNMSILSRKNMNKHKLQDEAHKIPVITSLIKYHQMNKTYTKEKQYAKVDALKGTLPSIRMLEAGDDRLKSIDSSVDPNQQGPEPVTEMIKGIKIVNYDPHYKNKLVNLSEDTMEGNNILPDLFEDTVKRKQNTNTSTDGVLQYKLSDKTFIGKGYTILPVIKVMKLVNVYKMEPLNHQFNWFERHRDNRTKNYDTGEILAEIKENGTGKWFYKNGRVALDYYNAEDVIAGQRYVLYSSGEECSHDQGARLKELKNKPHVLGVFDFVGNGVVYDLYGNERIKYNQTEGMIRDSKIGPVGRWKWHSLNDPPVLQPVVIDNYDDNDSPCISNLLNSTKDLMKKMDKTCDQNPEVLKMEFENFAKQKAHKLLQKFKPYQIRMKAFKINDKFSLRIIDQANIYLMFRHGTVSMKLNLGLHLISNEIVDTDVAEMGNVATPYDRIPPRTSSVASIQHNLQNARNLNNSRAPKSTNTTPESKLNVVS